jgi:hypothetical protein
MTENDNMFEKLKNSNFFPLTKKIFKTELFDDINKEKGSINFFQPVEVNISFQLLQKCSLKKFFSFKNEKDFHSFVDSKMKNPDYLEKTTTYWDTEEFLFMKKNIWIEKSNGSAFSLKNNPKISKEGSLFFEETVFSEIDKLCEAIKCKSKLVKIVTVKIMQIYSFFKGIKYCVSFCKFLSNDGKEIGAYCFCSSKGGIGKKMEFPKNAVICRSTLIEFLYRFKRNIFLKMNFISKKLKEDISCCEMCMKEVVKNKGKKDVFLKISEKPYDAMKEVQEYFENEKKKKNED